MPLGSKTRTYIAHAIVPVIRDNLVYANVIPCILGISQTHYGCGNMVYIRSPLIHFAFSPYYCVRE